MAHQKQRIDDLLRRLSELSTEFHDVMPHLHAVLSSEEDFRGLHIKVKDDGTTLCVVKRYSPDGTPEVCFGVGYGFFGCLVGADKTIQSGNWRFDKPWNAGGDS